MDVGTSLNPAIDIGQVCVKYLTAGNCSLRYFYLFIYLFVYLFILFIYLFATHDKIHNKQAC